MMTKREVQLGELKEILDGYRELNWFEGLCVFAIQDQKSQKYSVKIEDKEEGVSFVIILQRTGVRLTSLETTAKNIRALGFSKFTLVMN